MNLLTPSQIAERTQLNYRTVLRAIEDGELAAYKIRGRLRVPVDAFNHWLEEAKHHS